MILRNKYSYPEICYDLLERLSKKLPEHLTYHCLDHTIDVANTSNMYIEHYDIDDNYARLIRVAAIAHDIGYIESPVDHEERSIDILATIIKKYEYSQEEVAIIDGMIRATKIPQQPKTIYEQIIADADLDYLGRDDYDLWSENLYKEFLHYNIVSNKKEWLDAQIGFLKNHKYHTDWAIANRVEAKCQKLASLEKTRIQL